MATKLDNITGQYHSYVEDQVLTHYQLNETIDYFTDQDRLSRVFLTGTGIACGFVISITNTNDAITITQGTGITTDGDLIKLQKKATGDVSLTTKQKLVSVDFSNIIYKSYKPFTEDKGNYEYFKNSPTTLVPLFELLPEKPSGSTLEAGEQLLTAFPDLANIRDYVVILYLESYPKEASLCSQIDCSNQGGEEVFNLRVLITTQANADIIQSKDSLYIKYDFFNEYEALPELAVKKVVPTYSSIQSALQIKQLFNTVVSDAAFKTSLKNGITTILSNLGFSTQATTINNRITNLFDIIPTAIPSDIHYRYDLLKDILATYKELKDLFIQQIAECNPSISSFPKHLLLGKVVDIQMYKMYRHQFYKAPILDDQNRKFRNFQTLIQRLIEITGKFGIAPASNQVKIIPSKSTGKLGHKSIPYYYNIDNLFINSWDFDRSNIFISKANFSYHTTNLLSNDFIQFPLQYTLENHDFYRIEGYLNDDIDEVNNTLTNQRALHGLDFDFQILDVVENKDELKTLLKNNPSFEHKAGVQKGGTLLLLKEGDEFITDFAVDYKIAEEDSLDCCTIVACMYPWISSLKYINNLARSLKGTPSKVKAMPTHYVLNIRRYSINGISLINKPVILRIPLNEDIFLRRLHVVMERINQRFPSGLVFDFIEEQKKLKITRLEKDNFVFEVQDITLSNTSPVYTLTDRGITRNNRKYLAKEISCSIVNAYNEDIYKKLQSNYAPINKDDDDFGRFDEDWRKWEILRRKLIDHAVTSPFRRFITEMRHFNNIPTNMPNVSVGQELQQIANAIRNASTNFTNLEITIGGDWTNGNWVNSTMLDHYAQHQNDTNDDVALFVRLRKKLHNENGVSKYIIHINNSSNMNLDALIPIFNRYANKAEFYLQKPTNGLFIPIS
ncbi:conserved hypothetical protein [Flavobacterium sp. 9AF]|uniref:hypothetical protein n=1 Tax=Flavobacterium sp. 9AF TaxID=2653142 RepID=UPI0012F20EE6|nr:hypothetical protein [Flavobacterium sp. 9AF]VXB29908.1 conserved hypothetical protein [Flavobacterium sp. 9AF]